MMLLTPGYLGIEDALEEICVGKDTEKHAKSLSKPLLDIAKDDALLVYVGPFYPRGISMSVKKVGDMWHDCFHDPTDIGVIENRHSLLSLRIKRTASGKVNANPRLSALLRHPWANVRNAKIVYEIRDVNSGYEPARDMPPYSMDLNAEMAFLDFDDPPDGLKYMKYDSREHEMDRVAITWKERYPSDVENLIRFCEKFGPIASL